MQVIDVAKDPYGHKHYGLKKRKDFAALKRTPAFQRWKKRQLKVQNGKCGYCGIPLKHKDIVTHIDHIQPLRFGGTNAFENLVLSCRRCNVKKFIATNRVMPKWVKKNDEKFKKKERLYELKRDQNRLMRELVEREFDEQLGYELGQMF